jgi:epoxide hydrolase-like predicted phosphatase
MTIKAIIFDFGGVLVRESIDEWFDAMNKRIGKKGFVRRKGLLSKALRGRMGEKQHYRELEKRIGVPAGEIKMVMWDEYEKHMPLNREVMQLASRLRQNGYRTAVMSNITEMTKNLNRRRRTFRGFSPAIYSYEAGCIKPGRKIYKILLKKLKIPPEECVFIDDQKKNIETAKKMGMKGIVFKNPLQLKRDLRKLGVKI